MKVPAGMWVIYRYSLGQAMNMCIFCFVLGSVWRRKRPSEFFNNIFEKILITPKIPNQLRISKTLLQDEGNLSVFY